MKSDFLIKTFPVRPVIVKLKLRRLRHPPKLQIINNNVF